MLVPARRVAVRHPTAGEASAARSEQGQLAQGRKINLANDFAWWPPAITREVLIDVRSTFITPFDRGDIKDLISAMDDAIDQQKTAKAIVLFEIESFEPQMRAMADAIVDCAQLISRAVPLLTNIGQHAGQVSEICQQVSRIEGRADETCNQGLKALYERSKKGSAMDFVCGSEIYDHLEKSVDRFDDVANQIQAIVIDHV